MDSTGVPQKINRHVYRAVNLLTNNSTNCLTNSGAKLNNIYKFVRMCTKNLTPVPHLREVVQRSLNNFRKQGIVKVDQNIYMIKRKRLSGPHHIQKRNSKTKSLDSKNSQISFASPQSNPRKRKNDSNSTGDVDEINNVLKRFRASSKNISKTRFKSTRLPKHKKLSKPKNQNAALNGNEICSSVSDLQSDEFQINSEPGRNDRDSIDIKDKPSVEIQDVPVDNQPELTDNLASNSDLPVQAETTKDEVINEAPTPINNVLNAERYTEPYNAYAKRYFDRTYLN